LCRSLSMVSWAFLNLNPELFWTFCDKIENLWGKVYSW
jgi:hypothetical protein